MSLLKKNILLVLLLFCSVPSVLSLMHPGFFQSDDGEWMVIRFSAFYQALRDGQFPVRFLTRLNFGYGYPVANFLYPGFMYLGVPIHVLGFGFVSTIKIILGVSMIGSSVFTYLWLSKLFDRQAGFFGSLFYLYAPYHLYDLYKRGSVGEILALSVVPFVFWQIERSSLFWSAIGIGFFILSHNTLAILFLPIIVLYMLFKIFSLRERKKKIYEYILTVLLGLGTAAFFWMPAISDLYYTVFSKTSVSDFNQYFVDIKLVGISTVLIFISTIFLFVTKKINPSKYRLTALLFIIGIVSLFFATSISLPLWNLLPLAPFIQFPFRFLSVTILCAAFLFSYLLSVLPKTSRIIVLSVVAILTTISSQPFLQPQEFFDKGEGFYTTNEATTTVKNEYMPKWVEKPPALHPKNTIEVSKAVLSDVSIKSNRIVYTITPEDNAVIQINRLYFPGWVIKRDNKETFYDYPLDINLKNGIFHYQWGVGYGKPEKIKYELYFTETTSRLFADFISIISFMVLLVLSYKQKLWKL